MKAYQALNHITLGTTLRQLADQVSQDAENIYAQFSFDIDPKWFPVFYVLATKNADSVVNIAKEIKHSHVSVSKIVKEMKRADLLDTYKSDKDSRVTLITLNERARAMIPAMQAQCAAVDAVMNELTQETNTNLWQALTITQQHLQRSPLSHRIKKAYESDNIKIVDYQSSYREAFKALNIAWISKHWELEEPDYQAINNPEDYILNKNGVILIALHNNIPVGCCALIYMKNNTYELAKMAVSPQAQGLGIGLLLGKKIIAKAKSLGATRLYLESNSVLQPAINLYGKLGFQHIKGITSPYERCDVQMELSLENPIR